MMKLGILIGALLMSASVSAQDPTARLICGSQFGVDIFTENDRHRCVLTGSTDEHTCDVTATGFQIRQFLPAKGAHVIIVGQRAGEHMLWFRTTISRRAVPEVGEKSMLKQESDDGLCAPIWMHQKIW